MLKIASVTLSITFLLITSSYADSLKTSSEINALNALSKEIRQTTQKKHKTSLKEKLKAQDRSRDTNILNLRRGIANMARDPKNDLGRKMKGFGDNDKVVTVYFRFDTEVPDPNNFVQKLGKSTLFKEILDSEAYNRYYAAWDRAPGIIMSGVMSKKYFATLKYFSISDSQLTTMRKVTSSDIQSCTSDKGVPTIGAPWTPGRSTYFNAGPSAVAKFGTGFPAEKFLNNPHIEFEEQLSIKKIFDPKRSLSKEDKLDDMSVNKNKFYYTMPDGKVRYGYYSISRPHLGKTNPVIGKWIENRQQFRCLRASVGE